MRSCNEIATHQELFMKWLLSLMRYISPRQLFQTNALNNTRRKVQKYRPVCRFTVCNRANRGIFYTLIAPSTNIETLQFLQTSPFIPAAFTQNKTFPVEQTKRVSEAERREISMTLFQGLITTNHNNLTVFPVQLGFCQVWRCRRYTAA